MQPYDENDPDIKFLAKAVTAAAEGKLQQAETVVTVTNADKEDDKVFAAFDQFQSAAPVSHGPHKILRDIRSARPAARKEPVSPPRRPMTARQEFRSRPTTARMVSSSGFGVVGRHARFSQRTSTAANVAQPTNELRKAESVGRLRLQYRPATASQRVGSSHVRPQVPAQQQTQQQEQPMGTTRRSMGSVSSSPRSGEEAQNPRPQDETRPGTAGEFYAAEDSAPVFSMIQQQQRPMTAVVSMRGTARSYVVNNQMRCSEGRRRPISAAVNSVVLQGRERTQQINPGKTRRVYMHYIKELEKEASQFIIEEGRAKQQQQHQPKRKKVRMKKVRGERYHSDIISGIIEWEKRREGRARARASRSRAPARSSRPGSTIYFCKYSHTQTFRGAALFSSSSSRFWSRASHRAIHLASYNLASLRARKDEKRQTERGPGTKSCGGTPSD